MKLLSGIVLSFLLCASLYGQATYTTGFEPPDFVLGDVNGQDGWGHLDNSPTGGTITAVPAGSAPSFGTQSLAIVTRKAEFFGVSNHLFSATIDPPAGETGSTLEGVVVPDPQTHFSASLWYHTPAVPVVSERSDGRIAELNPSSKGPGANTPANRQAQVRVFNDPAGTVRVEIGWYSVSTTTFTVATVAQLQWGEWYRFDYLIELVDGTAGTSPNDRFNLSIYDEAGALLGSACGSTWEAAYKTGSFGGGTTPRAINGFDFWAVTGPNGTIVGHLDNLTMTAFTSTNPLAVTITGQTNVCAGGTTTLTANASGGSGTISAYTWRDAGNTVVGTNSTLQAGPGTYTVTVTDALCVNATSAPATVTAASALGVSISGQSVVVPGGTSTLTANVTGGSGTINSYAWRNAANTVVGTTSTYDAPAGTYTVTVTDATCGTAVSPAFTVAEAVPSPIPTASEYALLTLLATLAFVGVRRAM